MLKTGDHSDIEILITEELERANKIHKEFGSTHEAYAVIKEELEEAKDDIKSASKELKAMWLAIKDDDHELADECIDELQGFAVYAIEELIQVAAMCEKAKALRGKDGK